MKVEDSMPPAPTARPGLREVLFDTETTGLSAEHGDRVIEVACVEVVDFARTGREFHRLIDPERDVPAASTEIHGITREMLLGKPKFREIARDFLEFVGDSPMVAHNAMFDFGFLNAELARAGLPPLRNPYVDTVALAKRRFGGANASLDTLCRRFKIDLSGRAKHGALVDTRLLSEVYLAMNGGRARSFDFGPAAASVPAPAPAPAGPLAPRALGLCAPDEAARHRAFLARLEAPLWLAGAGA